MSDEDSIKTQIKLLIAQCRECQKATLDAAQQNLSASATLLAQVSKMSDELHANTATLTRLDASFTTVSGMREFYDKRFRTIEDMLRIPSPNYPTVEEELGSKNPVSI